MESPSRILGRWSCSVALLAAPARALFFEMDVGGEAECFGVTPKANHTRMLGHYEADGESEGIRVVLTNEIGTELWLSQASAGKFDVPIRRDGPGEHKLCFFTTADNAQMVSFGFRADTHEAPGDTAPAHHKEFATKEHTDQMQEMVEQLEAAAEDILDQQRFAITRESVHRDVTESTNARVMWWTFLEVGVLIMCAAFQIYYLRSYFEVKQVV